MKFSDLKSMDLAGFIVAAGGFCATDRLFEKADLIPQASAAYPWIIAIAGGLIAYRYVTK